MVKKAIITALILPLFVFPATAQEKKKDGFTKEELRRYFQQSDREYLENQKNIDPDEMHLLFQQLHKNHPSRRTVNSGDTINPNRQSAPSGAAGSDPDFTQNPDTENQPPLATDQTGSDTAPAGNVEKTKAAKGDQSLEPTSQADAAGQGTGPANGKHSSSKAKNHNRRSRQTDRYVPPSFTAGKVQMVGDFSESKSSKKSGPFFGIRRGTKFRAETRQVTTNVESNLMEIYVIQDVYGDYDLMAKETKLYANKSLNSGTNRLEALVMSGITPDGREFKMRGIVLDINKSAGLAGAIATDGHMAGRSVSSGAFEVGRSIVSTLNDGSIIGAGVEAAAENALDEKETEVDKGLNRPLYVISVEPQQFIIRVEETY